MDTGLTIRDVADLLFAARGRIDFYWNFYVVVVIAVIGWLLTSKRALTRPMKALVTAAFLVAALMNLIALYSSYSIAEALRSDLLAMLTTSPLPQTTALLEAHSFRSQRLLAIAVHLVIGAAILAAIWLRTGVAAGDESEG